MIRLSIRRPVAVAMAYVAVALLGVAAWRGIPLELLPSTDLPRLTISAEWRGSSPETVEAFLTSPLEGVAQRMAEVERVTSVSRRDAPQSRVTVEFARDADMDFVRLDLSERLARLEEELPEGVSRVRVEPYVPEEFQDEANRPLLTYRFTGPVVLEALREHLEERVAPELGQVEGVARAQVTGGRRRILEVELDPDRIAALGLTPDRFATEIQNLDLLREAGTVRRADREWTLAVRDRAASIDDLRNAVFSAGGPPLQIGDFAEVRQTFEEPRMLRRIDGSPAVTLQVHRRHGSNAVEVADRVRARVAELEALGPAGSRLVLVDDQSEDIRRQLTDLRSRALVSAAVIFLVLLVFLRSLRSAGVVFLTIAFSVLIALNLIYFTGFSLNLLTLMGLALGFGLVVDNSIVVLENVYRRWQEGDAPEDAAERGARHVVLAVVASTVTTLIVFVPFVYFQGELRIYYVPLAVVVALTLAASLLVAFTFIPSLTARLLAGRSRGGGDSRGGSAGRADSGAASEAGGRGASEARSGSGGARTPDDSLPLYLRFYSGLLSWTLRAPWAAVLVAALCLGGSWYLFDTYVTRGVVWGGGWGGQSWVDVQIQLPRGSDLERTDELSRYFEERLARIDEIERFETTISGNFARTQVFFPDSLEFTPIPLVVEERLRAYSLGFTGAEVRVFGQGPAFYGGGGSAPNYRIAVRGYNYERVRDIAEDLGARLSRVSRVAEMNTNAGTGFALLRDRATEFVVEVDRDALARYDMTVQELVGHMQAALQGTGGRGRVTLAGEPVDYEVKLAGFLERDVRGLERTLISSPLGTHLRLGDVVDVREREVLAEVRREDQQYHRTVAYEFRGPRALGDLYRDAALEATELPPGYSVQASDSFRFTEEELEQMWLVLMVSVGLVFMVTAALFESLRQPFCVLLAVPMALIGVFLIFFYTGASFTREAWIGVIMMGGIVVNNAILLVDHINRVRREGAGSGSPGGIGPPPEARVGSGGAMADGPAALSLEDAILEGTLQRVRPILMTTATTVLGLLPLVLFTATADATIWNALTYALIGGLLASTLFVLTVTPSLYLLFERGRAEPAAVDRRGTGPMAAPGGRAAAESRR